MKFYSIEYSMNDFKYYNGNIKKFSNFLHFNSEEAKNIIQEYKELFLKTFIEMENFTFKDLAEKEEKKEGKWERIDTNYNLELLIVTLQKYGYKLRFIIKEILLGNNFNRIEFINKNNEEDVIPPFLSDKNECWVFKVPIKLNGKNRVRLICVAHNKGGEETIIYPLLFDFNHLLYSLNVPKKRINVKDIFSEEFKSSLFELLNKNVK